PLAGDVAAITFLDGRADQLADDVRVNVHTDTAAIPDGLRAGDRYRIRTIFPESVERTALMSASVSMDDPPEPDIDIPDVFSTRAAAWVKGRPEPYAEMLAI